MRYYFDIFEGDHWTRDDAGLECANDGRARFQAVLALTEMAREFLPGDGPSMDLKVRVRRGARVAFTVGLFFETSAGPALSDPSIADQQPMGHLQGD
ncbi:DUF6894 family protein [Devosia sp. A16]|uniref:DUF6894 family protein n=1 Tax=Devosia sp. A16 TaxID=1736675 RepID=UPI0006D815B9|nr:hypothetical protein [Devosia sp. A16]